MIVLKKPSIKRSSIINGFVIFILCIFSVLALLPLIITITNSFMSESEITSNYSMIVSANDTSSVSLSTIQGYAAIKLIPDLVTIKQYYTVLVSKTQFLIMFWNSVKLVSAIVIGQVIVAAMAAYAFAKFKFRGRSGLFFVYIIVMMMPFQVTLVPNYIVADKLGLLGSYSSIILPGIFAAFGVFLLKQHMEGIPDSYIEAAKVDGATQFDIFTRIIIPLSETSIWALVILLFIDYWNMVEQPLIFLNDAIKMPLSIYLSSITAGDRGVSFAASTIYMLPMLLIFLYGENYLVQGIQLSGVKE